jgi:dTDP-4-dehydrorhamnose reductase
MRIAVIGQNGQLAQSLLERAAGMNIDVCTVARPEADLTRPTDIEAALIRLQPQAIVSAAAYTTVDLAESEPALAYSINVIGAAAAARAAALLEVPIVHLSTDYVFDGSLHRPYREDDMTAPIGVYGATKLEGERAVSAANSNHAILRTAWVYSPFGKNFARTMLTLASTRDEISVVSDQQGTPTNALDLAGGVLKIAQNLVHSPSAGLRGIFHMTSGGATNWASFAESIFAASTAVGGPSARVLAIPGSAYPAPARRPANSRLDNSRLAQIHQLRLPHWQESLPECIERLVGQDFRQQV